MYQTAVGRHGDRTRTAESSAVRKRARYHCAVEKKNPKIGVVKCLGA